MNYLLLITEVCGYTVYTSWALNVSWWSVPARATAMKQSIAQTNDNVVLNFKSPHPIYYFNHPHLTFIHLIYSFVISFFYKSN